MSCFDDHVILYHILAKFEFQFFYLLHPFISVAWQAWHINSKKYQSPKNREMSFSPLCVISRKTFQVLPHSENWKCLNDSFAGRSQRMVTEVNLIDKLHTDLGNYLLCKRLILHANMEIYCSFKSFAGGTWGFSYREDRSCTSQVVPWHSCKIDISSHVRSCKFSDSENDVDLILSLAGVMADLDPPRIWTPRSISASGFGPPWSKSASGYGPPFADLDPPTKLSF